VGEINYFHYTQDQRKSDGKKGINAAHEYACRQPLDECRHCSDFLLCSISPGIVFRMMHKESNSFAFLDEAGYQEKFF
jgi:hypothetical protein